MKEHKFIHVVEGATIFQQDSDRIWLNRLMDRLCGDGGSDNGPDRASGLGVVTTDQGRFEGRSFKVLDVNAREQQIRITWLAAQDTLKIESDWSFDITGVISRRDRLVNVSAAPVVLTRYHARFPFSMAHPQVYSQRSVWNHENQGTWIDLPHGKHELANECGRTTCGGTPYAAIRERGNQRGVAFHILPVGNWMIRAYAYAVAQKQPYLVVGLGQSDEDLRIELAPGEHFDAPELLIHSLPDGEVSSGTSSLHAYLSAKVFSGGRTDPPMLYNTWFYQFDRLDVPSLRRQLATALEIGCEVFVIDAGWFGPQGGGWWQQAGDWREKTDASFYGRMNEFADEVRAAGLGFGLWMEPERFAPLAPILKEHPDWFYLGDRQYHDFVPESDRNLYRIDLENPEAYRWLKSEMSRLVETYELAWMKVDSNFELGIDPARSELHGYYLHWYRMLKELRTEYPQCFFEGCASGGLRSDIHTISHFECHFLSDTVNPWDVLRIKQGAWLRMLPGRLTSWVVIRPADISPRNKDGKGDPWPTTIVTPGGASWENCEAVDINFAAAITLTGMSGISGDIASLPDEALYELRQLVEFFKHWRQFICTASGYLLTPPQPKEDRTGWVGMQLQEQNGTKSLLFVYRLYDWQRTQVFHPQHLDPSEVYIVNREDAKGDTLQVKGAELMQHGLAVRLEKMNRSAIYSIQPTSKR